MAAGLMLKFLVASAPERQAQLRFVAWLTAQWPTRFVQTMKRAGITASDFNHLDVPVPFWIASVVDSHLARPRYEVSEIEVQSATTVLASGRAPTTKIAVKRLLGVTDGAAVDEAMGKCATRLSLNELHRIVHLIDHAVISASAARDARRSWVRDAACMAVAAWNGERFPDVCSTSATNGAELISTWNSLADQHTASNTVLADVFNAFSRWMHDYMHRVRPCFETYGNKSEMLFLTRFGKQYRGFGLAGRLADLLRQADVSDWQRGVWLLAGVHLSSQAASS